MASPFADARILLTGATGGIGAATAEAFCREGCKEIVVTGRREELLKEKARTWSDTYGCDVAAIVLDVRSRPDIEAIAAEHPSLFDVDILVNNAGLARGREGLHESQADDWEEMVETNILGLLYVTRQVLPHMVARGAGHIVNLGSVAGRWTYTGGAVYSGTKAAVARITEGLRMDLLGKNVRVSNIEPGMVETGFSTVRFRGDERRAREVYANTRPLRPEDVAETILWVCSRPAHVNVQELVLYPTDQAHVGMVHRRPA
ncbi:MAG TPA: SDR family NAD(P)-dependent oxidoreductase [Candidatus Thermoplasmatota archaeon]|nr:SDR family NAD(P)-dependent oxidoreductase [Candidatus Thermoplasmatota archaeon]